jgi:ABC-type transporter Mla subunit MlaD
MVAKSQQQQHIDDIHATLARLDAAGKGVSDRLARVEPVVGNLVDAIQHVGAKVDQVESATNHLTGICQAVVNHANTSGKVANQNKAVLAGEIKRLKRDIWVMLALIFVFGGVTSYMCFDLQAKYLRLRLAPSIGREMQK